MSALKPHQIIGFFDDRGSYRWKIIFKEADGTLSQQFPGHFDQFDVLAHKRWRWDCEKNRLDRSFMDWEPDVEEMDKIEQLVKRECFAKSVPRFALEGKYPHWKQIA